MEGRGRVNQGRVRDSQGRPLAGLLVAATGHDVRDIASVSGSDGVFALPPLAPGQYVLHVFTPAGRHTHPFSVTNQPVFLNLEIPPEALMSVPPVRAEPPSASPSAPIEEPLAVPGDATTAPEDSFEPDNDGIDLPPDPDDVAPADSEELVEEDFEGTNPRGSASGGPVAISAPTTPLVVSESPDSATITITAGGVKVEIRLKG